MTQALDQGALDQLFLTARTHAAWLPEPVSDAVLHQLYELMRMAPTSANCAPARILFLRTPAAKERLMPALSPGNVDKTMSAPVTAIIAYDLRFYDQLPFLFPHRDVRPTFARNAVLAQSTAFRNSSLQGAYFMLAARALGLDCGPMSGFDQSKVDLEFFAPPETSGAERVLETLIRTNFLCNLGYGDGSALMPRLPRLSFEDACTLL